MSSRDRPYVRTPSEGVSPGQTGYRSASGDDESGSGRSGEYRAIRPTAEPAGPSPFDDRLTPTEPMLTAGKPLPALQRPAPAEARPRAMSNPALERPYASLPPSPKRDTNPRPTTDPRPSPDPRRTTDPQRPRSEPPPSVRRPLSAGAQRKLGICPIHRAALSPKGDCVVCRREAERHERARWSTITLLIVVAVAVAIGVVLAR